jgi:hypothetical protein
MKTTDKKYITIGYNGKGKIQLVKRLFDGQVFEIGDWTSQGRITSFKEVDGEVQVKTKSNLMNLDANEHRQQAFAEKEENTDSNSADSQKWKNKPIAIEKARELFEKYEQILMPFAPSEVIFAARKCAQTTAQEIISVLSDNPTPSDNLEIMWWRKVNENILKY